MHFCKCRRTSTSWPRRYILSDDVSLMELLGISIKTYTIHRDCVRHVATLPATNHKTSSETSSQFSLSFFEGKWHLSMQNRDSEKESCRIYDFAVQIRWVNPNGRASSLGLTFRPPPPFLLPPRENMGGNASFLYAGRLIEFGVGCFQVSGRFSLVCRTSLLAFTAVSPSTSSRDLPQGHGKLENISHRTRSTTHPLLHPHRFP